MMLVYNMPATEALYKRFLAIDGSAYFIGGFGMTAAVADEMVVVPIRSGIGPASASTWAISSSPASRPGTRSKGGETCVAAGVLRP